MQKKSCTLNFAVIQSFHRQQDGKKVNLFIKLFKNMPPQLSWSEHSTHNRLVAGSSPARATKSLFTYQEELRVQGVLDGGLYFMTNAISRKKCGGWFRMRAGVLVRGTPLQCIYPSVLIQKYLEKMPAMPSGQIAYMWN